MTFDEYVNLANIAQDKKKILDDMYLNIKKMYEFMGDLHANNLQFCIADEDCQWTRADVIYRPHPHHTPTPPISDYLPVLPSMADVKHAINEYKTALKNAIAAYDLMPHKEYVSKPPKLPYYKNR